jgi:putative intracellular protease/amidase
MPLCACLDLASLEKDTMKNKVLIAVTSHNTIGSTGRLTGAYLSEVSPAVFECLSRGFEIAFVSPQGGQVPLDGVDRKNPQNVALLDDPSLMKQLHASAQPQHFIATDYAGIYFAGGHGTMWDFPDNAALAQLAAAIYENGGIVAAVCHGPAALVNAKLSTGAYLVAGKAVSAFTNAEEAAVGLAEIVPFLLETKLAERGATFMPAPNWQAQVVVSERLVTGQNPASAKGVAETMGRLLSALAI